MTLKTRLKNKLKSNRKPFTQKGVAKKLGISQPYLSQILNGTRKAPARIIKKLEKEILD